VSGRGATFVSGFLTTVAGSALIGFPIMIGLGNLGVTAAFAGVWPLTFALLMLANWLTNRLKE